MTRKAAISIAESAVEDLEDIRAYYQKQQVPEIGEHFLREIIAAIESLPDHPERGRIVPEFNQPWLRELIHPPFRIVYRHDKLKIRNVRIWRSERLMRPPE